MPKFVEPTVELLEQMAPYLRDRDVHEVKASHGQSPIEALKVCVKLSEYSCVVVDDNGVPFIAFGVVVMNRLTGLGIPWMLSTPGIFDHADEFVKTTPRVIEEMHMVCPRLENHVHIDNVTSIRWLASLGFKIEKPAPYGVAGELFCRFHKEI